jgi:hypothetical protein
MMAIRRVAHFSIPVSDAKAASEGDQGEVGARLIRLSQRDDGVDGAMMRLAVALTGCSRQRDPIREREQTSSKREQKIARLEGLG